MWRRHQRSDADFREEIESHLAHDADRHIADGLGFEQAQAAARRGYGSVAHSQEQFHLSRRVMWLDDLRRDTKQAMRALTREPGVAAIAIFVLALGIGANTAIFSLMDAVLWRPLPFHDPDRLVMVWEDQTRYGSPHGTPAPANFVDWKAQNQVFEDMAAMVWQEFAVTGLETPDHVAGLRVTANLPSLLGVHPVAGRVFQPDDDLPDAVPTVMLGHGFWQRRFGGDTSLVGHTISLNGIKRTVVGVMPAGWQFPSRDADLWVPAAFTPQELAQRDAHYLLVMARLKRSASVHDAEANMAVIARELERQYPISNKDLTGIRVVPFREHYAGSTRVLLSVLLASVATVLLIACANVAQLLLVRGTSRRREMAMRAALGAGRARVLRQLLTECLVLVAISGLLGLALSTTSFVFLAQLIPASFPQETRPVLSVPVFGFATVVALATAVLCGIGPALQVAAVSLNDTLKSAGRWAGRRSGRLLDSLVVVEMTLTVLLLVAAGLLAQSYERLRGVGPGFRPDGVLTIETVLSPAKYAELSRRTAFLQQVLERVRAIPGVRASGYVNYLPLTFKGGSMVFSIEGRPAPGPGQLPVQTAYNRNVSADYFRAMGIPLIRGRVFDERDGTDTTAVAIISETMARTFWPNEDPVGVRIAKGLGGVRTDRPAYTVVGVVGDVKQMGLDVPVRSDVYFPLTQSPSAGTFAWPRHLVLRAAGDPRRLASEVRRIIWSVDPDQPVSNIRTMDDILDREVSDRHAQMLLLGALSLVALVLATVGLYGVLSYRVAQRTPEIGVRMALGADGQQVLNAIVRRAAVLAVIGVALGLFGAWALAGLVSSLLFSISPTDPITFAVVTLILIGVAVAASYVPARRAARVDPLVALRAE